MGFSFFEIDMHENLSLLQQQVFELIGRLVLNYQDIETRLKTLLDVSNKSFPVRKQNEITSISAFRNQTLGGLKNHALQDFFRKNTETYQDLHPEIPDHVHFSTSLTLQQQSWERLQQDFHQFVERRNFLIHHFYSEYSLNDEMSCTRALNNLQHHYQEQIRFIEQFNSYCTVFAEAMDEYKCFLESPVGRTAFIFPADEIYRLICNLIENNKKNAGWLSLTTALQQIAKQFPDCHSKIKQKYGFKNLSDLILNSGLYQLKILPTQNGEKILFCLNDKDITFIKEA